MLSPFAALAQSQESNNFYNKGVELYNAEQYQEAIGYLRKSDSLEKKELEPSSPIYNRSNQVIASAYGNLAIDQFNSGNYDDAVRYGKIALDIQRQALGEDHPDYIQTLDNLANFHCATGNVGEAIRLGTIAMNKRKENLGEQHPDYAQSLNNLATYNYYIGKYDDAIRLGSQASEIWKTAFGDSDPRYAQSLGNLADYHSKTGNYTEALRLAKTTMEIFKKALGDDDPNYAHALSNLALYYYETGNYKEAIRLGTQAADIRKRALGEGHPDYAQSISNLAEFNSRLGKYDEALRLGNLALQIKKATIGEGSPDYAMALNNLARYHSNMGDYAEAIRLSSTATNILQRTYGAGHPDYALSLGNLASFNSAMGDYAEAIRIGTVAAETIKQIFGEGHPDYAAAIDNLSNYNYQAGNTTNAIELGTKAMEIRKRTLGTSHPDYATSLNNLAAYHAANANFNDAIKLQNAAIDIRKKTLGTSHPDYAQSIASLASYYCSIGNYNEAIRLGKQALEIRKNTLGEQHPDYAKSLLSLADFYSKSGKKDESIKLVSNAMEIDRQTLGDNHPAYAASLSNLAMYQSENGNYKEAIRLATIAMQIDEYNVGTSHPDFASSVSNLAVYYSNDGNYKEAIRLESIATDIRQKALGEDHPLYARSLNNLAAYNLIAGNYAVATEQLSKRYEITNSYILKNFATMTAQERTNFWSIHSTFFNYALPFAAYKNPTSAQSILAYNGQLFSKGLLLNAELEIQKLIEKSGDQKLAERFNKIRSDRATLDHLYQTPAEKRHINADSLAAVIEKEEKQLVESSKELGDYTNSLAINWKDVQNKLTDKDIAIEFADFNDDGKHSYIALVLKKDMAAPQTVKLNVNTADPATFYTTTDLYNQIWQPLQKYMQGLSNVYFAPSGQFHSIAIEYLPDDSGELMAKKYNVYRLTSTRELAIDKPVNNEKKAAVYGGIVYNFSKGNWQDLKNSKDEIVAEFRDIPDFDDEEEEGTQRAGIGFLKGAQVEAETVTDILRDGNYLVSFGTNIQATEESFKQLSGTGVKLMHIATHGFYEPMGKKKSFSDFLTTGNQNNKEDLSLSRSGLFLAGASSALDPAKRKDIPEGVEDGILTAKEISRLDFQGLDLVVLSACQTGLGQITGEGVFGLQRGFKKAGAQTIVMSLWKVDDAATKDLMMGFYENMTHGMSKREAFAKAQDQLRQDYPDPKKWAAFIMVDAL